MNLSGACLYFPTRPDGGATTATQTEEEEMNQSQKKNQKRVWKKVSAFDSSLVYSQ